MDSGELVNWVRVVKSPHEQEKMRAAGAIADTVMRTALDAVAPGRRQCDVVAEILAAQATGTPSTAGTTPRSCPCCRPARRPAPRT